MEIGSNILPSYTADVDSGRTITTEGKIPAEVMEIHTDCLGFCSFTTSHSIPDLRAGISFFLQLTDETVIRKFA